ncbi:MAG TPA: DUF3006 domain-containing protein [Terriglobales bacterium]|nr:DUF3006 domain-containing protein [Terriglobales bacterium]
MTDETRWTIDFIEEGVAAVEVDAGGTLIHLPLSALPAAAVEGDVLRVERSPERIVIERDAAAREAALERSREQTKARPDPRDPGGPIRL